MQSYKTAAGQWLALLEHSPVMRLQGRLSLDYFKQFIDINALKWKLQGIINLFLLIMEFNPLNSLKKFTKRLVKKSNRYDYALTGWIIPGIFWKILFS